MDGVMNKACATNMNLQAGEPCLMSAMEAARRMAAGEWTAMELLERIRERTERLNPVLKAIATSDFKRAARQAEAPLPGPFSGVPVTIKDVWETDGLLSTAGHPAWKDRIPQKDAPIVTRLKAAGAVVIGKTNMPEMAADSQTDSPLFGRAANPWDVERTPGGSTGGGAAAVAAGLSFLEVGNDMMGSIRIPAHFCGICGFVPTAETMPGSGCLLPEPDSHMLRSFLRPGFLARSVEDLEAAWRATAGPGEADRSLFPVSVATCREPSAQELRIIWSRDLDHLPLDAAVESTLGNWLAALAKRGVQTTDMVAGTVAFREASKAFLELFMPAMTIGLPSLLRRVIAGTAGRRVGGPHQEVRRIWAAERIRDDVMASLETLLENAGGLLACPAAAVAAYPHMKADGHRGFQPMYKNGIPVNGKLERYATVNVGYALPFTVTGNPVLVLPTGLTREGLPVGVQLVGRRFRDAELLAAGAQLARLLPFVHHPRIAD